ncbi:MAG: hypothetical protein MUD02_10205 [Bacteroidales bacterium]|jgi:hypothetical protein|nr:hypothetical protein [Bacteroidales bacterium]
MEQKKFTQFGTFSVAVLGTLFIVTAILPLVLRDLELFVIILLLFVALAMAICLLIFYKLTIIVDDTHLSFRMGAGIVSKKIRLADIKECRAVRNSPLTGIGIRLYSKGWLYNVSGLDAIELSFRNRPGRLRIGTDVPNEVAAYVNSKLGTGTPSGPEPFNAKAGYALAGFVIIALFSPVILLLSGRRETRAVPGEESLTLKGIYGITINYKDISRLDTIRSIPRIKSRTNGYALGGILKGNFRMAGGEDVKLFVNLDSSPFIFIGTQGKPVYINFENPSETLRLYSLLADKTGKGNKDQ